MIRETVVILLFIQTFMLIECKKQQVTLSGSYLPVAMQVIAHLTDQMAYEKQEEPAKPTTKPPFVRPTTKPTYRPTTATQRPQSTNRPYVTNNPASATWKPTTTGGWWMTYTTSSGTGTTPFHRPGVYAPVPPKPGDRNLPKDHFVLLPIDYNSQYTVLEPKETKTEEPLLSPESHSEVHPIIEPKPEAEPLLPIHDGPMTRTDDGIVIEDEELSDDNLQYLSTDIKETLKLANNPKDERAIDIWGEDTNRKAFIDKVQSKGKLSSSNLRLLLLYDLLSREAKRQKLSDYSGFSPEIMKELSRSASDGARGQLSIVLANMVDRRDCQHEYANNRAKEMVEELKKDESKLSAEIGPLHPLVYKL